MGTSILVALALAGFGGGEPPDGRLVLGVHGHGEWAAVADPGTGDLHWRRLAGGTLCRGPLLAVGDRVVFSGHRGRRAVVRALPLSLSGPARVVGPAEVLAPSPDKPTLWLGRWTRNERASVLLLREVGPEGDVIVRARALLPREGMLHAALSRAFVVSSGRALIVWDRLRDIPLRIARDARFVASHQWRFAWCRGECRSLRVWRPRGERPLALPAGSSRVGRDGAFSPDGRSLAVGLQVGGRPRLAVAELRTRRWTLLPGDLDGYQAMAWSPSGRWLYFTAGDDSLRAWSIGSGATVPLPIDPGGTVMSIATGSAASPPP